MTGHKICLCGEICLITLVTPSYLEHCKQFNILLSVNTVKMFFKTGAQYPGTYIVNSPGNSKYSKNRDT